MFVFLQGGRAFALKIAHLKDPELRELAADLPLRTIDDGALLQSFSEIQGMVFILQ